MPAASRPPTAQHWDRAYADGDTGRSWYQDHAVSSLELITEGGDPQASIIDIGGGASTLVDDLLAAGYPDVTVLDVSAAAIELARERLGDAGSAVGWISADLLAWAPPRTYDIWHDRAVLHFFTGPAQRIAYQRVLMGATHPGSQVVIGVFGPNGPEQCSGLPVHRYDAAELADFLGPEFEMTRTFDAEHTTPAGGVQNFIWVSAVRIAA